MCINKTRVNQNDSARARVRFAFENNIAYQTKRDTGSTMHGRSLLCPAKMKIKCQSDLLRDKSEQFAHCTLTRKHIITGLFRW